ncbi:DASH family cryptochrome [Robiginitalea sediminis]|uniref:DASH family cryptochrome n=1 Tax=Robiginitalea sediminis TaxID=1982593 RepID=UPI000B4B4759|nr:DASH family cryptochrome [Robiginitalea sediminis]
MSVALYWFRNDLRVSDHPGLTTACRSDSVLTTYCLNPGHFDAGDYGVRRTGPYRARFLLETLTDLEEGLRAQGIPFYLLQGEPGKAIAELARTHGVTEIHLQKEWTRDEARELEAVARALPGVRLVEHYNQFLFHPEDVPYDSFTRIPEVFTAFRKACEKQVQVRRPLAPPRPKRNNMALPEKQKVPGLAQLGLPLVETDPRTAFPFAGGWQAARERLNAWFWKNRRLSYYKHTRNGLVGTEYSSKFSPWLANGSLSPREIYWEVKRYEQEVVKNQDTYWLIFELIWRDYFKYIALKHEDRIFHPGGIRNLVVPREDSRVLWLQWTRGETENDFVNANMKELALTGWMSNRGRQNVASYWSQSLGQDWRLGAAWFEYLLLDYDVHSNWGNWMYNSKVGNDPRQRSFNPSLQASRYDADGRFRKTWLQPTLFENPVFS